MPVGFAVAANMRLRWRRWDAAGHTRRLPRWRTHLVHVADDKGQGGGEDELVLRRQLSPLPLQRGQRRNRGVGARAAVDGLAQPLAAAGLRAGGRWDGRRGAGHGLVGLLAPVLVALLGAHHRARAGGEGRRRWTRNRWQQPAGSPGRVCCLVVGRGLAQGWPGGQGPANRASLQRLPRVSQGRQALRLHPSLVLASTGPARERPARQRQRGVAANLGCVPNPRRHSQGDC